MSPRQDSFEGRAVEPFRGKSWVDYLSGRSEAVYGPDDSFGWELFGSRALRQGDWKITDVGDGTWRLFDLATDAGETNDLALDQPEQAAALVQAWQAYSEAVGVVMPETATYRP